MKVSVVINTLNRAEDLQRTLASLALQRYRDFEVIVVNGPSIDRTPEVISAWRSQIKTAHCPEANLSMSRNIGIATAAGDVVAFVDDDAIPEPAWLNQIVEAYDCDDVGGVGGWVHDASGHGYQTKYILCDRFATSRTDLKINPTQYHNCPGALEYCSLLGTNSSFRRAALVEMGGFDEEFAYFLDETDVSLRLVDRGYRIVFVEKARVLHKFAPSDMRNMRRVLRNRYQIIKNQCYFSFLHGAPALGYAKALEEVQKFVQKHRDDVKWCVAAGLLDAGASERYEEEAEAGVRDGILRVTQRGPARRLSQHRGLEAPFRAFELQGLRADALTIVLVSQSYPPGYVDGVGRFTAELAAGLATLGNEVHVVTSTSGDNRVDLEELVWVHRVQPASGEGRDPDIPPGIWAKSTAALEEIRLIAETAKIDVIQATGWDVEGIAALRRFAGDAVLITSLHTPMMVAAATHPNWLVDEGRMSEDIFPIMRLERELFLFSDGVYANSHDIVETIRRHYGIELKRLSIVPHGMRDRAALAPPARPADEPPEKRMRILFVGRLETRKGIDVLLDAMPAIFARVPNAEIWLIGQDHTEGVGGESTIAAFHRRYGAQAWMAQLRFFGQVQKEFLDEYYLDCDLVVMPSRYESFGLVLLEAMMHARPVVATRAGGMKEVVVDGETGLLVPPGDAEAFAEAVIALGLDPERRRAFGANGRRRFEQNFTAEIMAETSLAMYRALVQAKREGKLPSRRAPPPQNLALSRPWSLSDFWFESPLRKWTDDRWFTPAPPVWIALLAREAMARRNSEHEPQTLVIGSSEPIDFLEELFPGAEHVARTDLPNRGYWADSSVPKRDLNRLGLRDASFDLALVLKPIVGHRASMQAALAEISQLVRVSGVLAFTTDTPMDGDLEIWMRRHGFDIAEREIEAHRGAAFDAWAPLYSVVVTRARLPNLMVGPATPRRYAQVAI